MPNADTEWKFAKTSLIISYYNKHNTLPSPFNLFPGAKKFRLKNYTLNTYFSTYREDINTTF